MLWSSTRISPWTYIIFIVHFTSEVMAQTFILTQLYHYLASESTMEAKLGALAQIEMCAEEIETER